MGEERSMSLAFYSLIRYIPDPARNEPRNAAVVLSDAGDFVGMRFAPISRLSPKLAEQGILDGILSNVETCLLARRMITKDDLIALDRSWSSSLEITSPEPVSLD